MPTDTASWLVILISCAVTFVLARVLSRAWRTRRRERAQQASRAAETRQVRRARKRRGRV